MAAAKERVKSSSMTFVLADDDAAHFGPVISSNAFFESGGIASKVVADNRRSSEFSVSGIQVSSDLSYAATGLVFEPDAQSRWMRAYPSLARRASKRRRGHHITVLPR